MSKLDTGSSNENKLSVQQILLNSVELSKLNSLLDKYNEIFREEPGRVKGYECNINIKPTAPIAQRSYLIHIH